MPIGWKQIETSQIPFAPNYVLAHFSSPSLAGVVQQPELHCNLCAHSFFIFATYSLIKAHASASCMKLAYSVPLIASLWPCCVTALGIKNCLNNMPLPHCAILDLFAAGLILLTANLPSGIDAGCLNEVLLECCVIVCSRLASHWWTRVVWFCVMSIWWSARKLGARFAKLAVRDVDLRLASACMLASRVWSSC